MKKLLAAALVLAAHAGAGFRCHRHADANYGGAVQRP
jgi:hypothetical protein